MEQRRREDETNGDKVTGEKTLLIANTLVYGLHNYRSPAS